MTKRISYTLILVLLIAAFITSAAFTADTKISKKTALIFTFDAPEDNAGVAETYFTSVTEGLRDALNNSPVYAPYIFSDRMSIVKRGKDDGSLKNNDIIGPYSSDLVKTGKLAKLASSDAYIVGSVDSVSVDSVNKTASVTLSGALLDTESGKILMSWLETGTVPSGAQSASDEELRALATSDAISKVIASIAKTYPKEEIPSAKQIMKKRGLPPTN
jgi:hypothetical protein